MNLQQIKSAVDQGRSVHWSHDGYQVIKDNTDHYLIKCLDNDSMIGLTWQDGKTLNGEESDFFVYGSISHLKELFKENFDSYDKWGSTLSAFFTVAAEITHRGDITPSKWDYHAGIADDPRDHDDYLFDACEKATTDDLVYFGNILDRYTRNLDRIGESY